MTFSIVQNLKTTLKEPPPCNAISDIFNCLSKWVANLLRSDKSKSFAAALFYGCCSVSMNFLNKAVVSSFDFNYPFFIMVCQMVITVVVLDSLRMLGYISLRPYSFRDGCEFLPASIFFALHATLSLYAIHGMNIPMYGAIKRCTPIVSLILSVLVLRKAIPSRYIVASILLITLGCLVASAGDLEFDGQAYAYGFLSVFAQGGYLTLVQRSSMEMKRSTIELIHINGFNTLPFFTIVSMCIQEPIKIADSKSFHESGFIPTFIILVLSGCILTFSQFLCAAVSSALTASLVGVAKSVLQTVIGFFTFGGVKFHPLNILGLVLNMIGGIMYSYVKYHEGERKKRDNSVTNLTSLDPQNPANLESDSKGGLRKQHMSDADLFNGQGTEQQALFLKRGTFKGDKEDPENQGLLVNASNGYHLDYIEEHVKS